MTRAVLSQNKEITTGELTTATAFYVERGSVEINTTVDNVSWMPFYVGEKWENGAGITARIRNTQKEAAVVVYMDF